ncbi:hypothetical protein TEA_006860 [Camellia sinensis var. sinensis]|uniref:Pentacotripeptide-repeat region of PRORP domain-containing protein n=1 Tax=Camellia sinensis var. sinensis TaxID=542762 RepID=A0A4S4ELH9_CAMSN|nr:hypothetical protein TEA_006860 [Camellia sinensis var. sinensis]
MAALNPCELLIANDGERMVGRSNVKPRIKTRGKGWKYGSGFVDGIFFVRSPIAQQILNFVQKEVDVNRIWSSLDTLPPTNTTWDDIITVAVQLRLNKRWDPIILVRILYSLIFLLVCEWILYKSSFHPDVICYNLLIDAYGQKSQHDKAESTYLDLLEGQCIPTEDTYALLVKAYCVSGLLEKAEAIFAQMRKNGHPPSIVVYNAYIDGLIKGRNSRKVEEIFERMKRDHCQPTTDTYTMDGLCEKAEETFEQLQEAGYEPDVYAYNALLEAYSLDGAPGDSFGGAPRSSLDGASEGAAWVMRQRGRLSWFTWYITMLTMI